MRIIFLGTSGGLPTPRRSLPSVAVLRDGEMMLFDCGEGTQTQIMRKGLGFGRLSKIFISHLHGDHLSGLMGLLMSLTLLEHETPLDIYGPPQLAPFYDSLVRDINLRTKFPVTIKTAEPGCVVREEDYIIEAAPVRHSSPCLAFALQEKMRPGRFDLDHARELGIPEGPLFGRLQKGEQITLDDGRVIASPDVLGPARKGRRIVYVTDTMCHPPIIPFCRDADLLIHEGMFTNDMEDEARLRKHCTAAQAAFIAREAGAKRLVLVHLSARHGDTNPLRDEARAVFPGALVAHDLMEIEIPYED
ncbi:MAG: ribonuclease Z [bacterium]